MQHLHLLKIKDLPVSNTYLNGRISIYSARFEQRVYIDRLKHKSNNVLDIAAQWLIDRGFVLVSYSYVNGDWYIGTSTFQPLKKEN